MLLQIRDYFSLWSGIREQGHLLGCSAECGTQVFEQTAATRVDVADPDKPIVHYATSSGDTKGEIAARYIVDASGQSAIVARLRIPMKTATDSDGKRPPVPIQNGHFSRGSNMAS